MTINILHLSDIHMGSGFSHGKINPETGINTRLEDFVKTLSICIDRAISEPVDLVLFGGDAFPDATPAPYIHEAFASQFRRLADAKIPTILLVGNHDQHSQGNGGASLSIYRTLVVPGFIVGDSITTHRITTGNGDIQVITLPWLNHSTLLTRPETEGLSLGEVSQLLLERLQPVLEAEIRRLDPTIPTVLLGHLMADRANLGAERFLAVGKGFTIPVSFLIRPELDYVALGHVHKHQNLNKANNPPIIYPGSIDRVDFSEEKEDKGYVMVNVAKGEVQWEFCPLPVRPFCTIEVDVSEAEDPQQTILDAIAQRLPSQTAPRLACSEITQCLPSQTAPRFGEAEIASKDITDAVVRLIYKLRSEQLELISTTALDQALKLAHSYTIRPELVSQLARPRLPELGLGNTLDPLDALKAYLDNKEDLREIASDMLEAAQELLETK